MKLFPVISVIGGYINNAITSLRKYIKDTTPFSNLTDIELDKRMNEKSLIPKNLNENLQSFFDQINRLAENDDVTNCKYYDINKFKRLKLRENNEKFSLLHMNILSLPYHFDNFQQLLLNLKIDFHIIDITESRIKSRKAPAFLNLIHTLLDKHI